MRQPGNAWLWVYMFDYSDQPVVTFCGRDDYNSGLAQYVEQLKSSYSEEDSNGYEQHTYKIAAIVGSNQNGYEKAQSLLVLANDISLGHREVCDETVSFLLPQSAWNYIVNISNHRLSWTPDMSEFEKDDIYFKGLAGGSWLEPQREVWRHKSVPGSSGGGQINTNDINQIPNWESKLSALRNQGYNNGWYNQYSSLREYVISLAEGDDVQNFWSEDQALGTFERFKKSNILQETKRTYNTISSGLFPFRAIDKDDSLRMATMAILKALIDKLE